MKGGEKYPMWSGIVMFVGVFLMLFFLLEAIIKMGN
jgi:hypothetical protein